MNKRTFFTCLLLFSMLQGFSQTSNTRFSQYVDLAATVGQSQGSVAGSFVHNWKVGKRKKIEIGIGGRVTSYFGTKKDFLTAAPARYTRSHTIPFLIFFAGQEEQNFDTLTVQRPFTTSVNALVNLGYHFTDKWYAGFNIDLVGFTFGKKSSSVFTSNGITQTDPSSKPTSFNVLLTGDHDIGSLNSEFYLRYKIARRWSLKAIYQFVFVEYEAQSVKQTFSDGNTNNRFRNKANHFGIGASYFFTY